MSYLECGFIGPLRPHLEGEVVARDLYTAHCEGLFVGGLSCELYIAISTS